MENMSYNETPMKGLTMRQPNIIPMPRNHELIAKGARLQRELDTEFKLSMVFVTISIGATGYWAYQMLRQIRDLQKTD